MSLQTNQRTALESLVAGSTVSQAAAAAGVQESTVYKWRTDNHNGFMDALNEANERILSDTVLALTIASIEAVNILRNVMCADETPPQTKVSAAKAVLDSTIKVRELYDFEQRLSALEESIAS